MRLGRVVLALVLMALYVVIALATVVGLLWVAKLVVFARLSFTTIALAVVCVIAAGVVAASLWPRRERFKPPGPEIRPLEQPALFDEIRKVAERTGERPPDRIYVTMAINAAAAQHGGIAGFGGTRVMVIGLPLLRVLEVSELRGVLAHEMGHFHGGDTGAWLYRTRAAVTRTFVAMQRARGELEILDVVLSIAGFPFRCFAWAFLHVTQAISREQERRADQLAAHCVGSEPTREGLRKVHGSGMVYDLFMTTEVAPLVAVGRLPDVGEGFTRFLAHPHGQAALQVAIVASLAKPAGRFDSHPALADRIASLPAIEPVDPDRRSAIELVDDATALERRVFARDNKPLDPIPWNATSEAWELHWRRLSSQLSRVAPGLRIPAVPTASSVFYKWAIRFMATPVADQMSEAQLRGWATNMMAMAACVMLLEEGFTLTTALAEPVVATRDAIVLRPFELFAKYLKGELSQDDWRQAWTGIDPNAESLPLT